MGTRHLVAVVHESEFVVAQYGHYDGYPSGHGLQVLRFLREGFDNKLFVSKLPLVRFVTEDEREARGREPESLSLHASSKIMEIIQKATDTVDIVNSRSFADDSLFCEWCYVVDLDKNTFEVYKGMNKAELGHEDRFYSDELNDEEYKPVKIHASYPLGALPSDDAFLRLD